MSRTLYIFGMALSMGAFASPARSAPRPTAGPERAAPVPRLRPIQPPLFRFQALEDPGGKGLRHVLERLSCLKAQGTPKLVRIAHYGDSIVATDEVSGGARRVMQARFGDGGHGFLIVKPPSRWYHREGVWTRRSKYWRVASMIHNWYKRRRYGLGGAISWTHAPGAWLRLYPKKEGRFGGRTSRLRVYFERYRHGGWMRLRQGRKVLGRIDTRLPGPTRSRKHVAASGVFTFPETDRRLTLELGGGGGLYLHGIALERKGPGVVWDGLGMTSARIDTLGHLPPEHWRKALQLRGTDLVVIQYGANISDLKRLPEAWYVKRLRRVLSRLTPIRKRLSCLVVGPVDRGFRWKHNKASRPIVGKIAEVQRRVAFELGCAFWDSRAAMGGPGAARRWLRAKPPLIWGDLTHLRPAGAYIVGRLMAEALLHAHDQRNKRLGARACPRTAPTPTPTPTPTHSPSPRAPTHHPWRKAPPW